MKPKVLIIEDTAEAILLATASLGCEFETSFAKNLVEARRFLSAVMPDLILLDASLPDGDGFTFCSWLKTHPKYQNVPIIFLTGRTEEEEKAYALGLGADGYVTKPFQPKALKQKILDLLNK